MKYHLNIYTNWVRQCNTQVKARLLLCIKLRLLFLKAVNIINCLIDRKLLYASSLYFSRLVWYFNLILEGT